MANVKHSISAAQDLIGAVNTHTHIKFSRFARTDSQENGIEAAGKKIIDGEIETHVYIAMDNHSKFFYMMDFAAHHFFW